MTPHVVKLVINKEKYQDVHLQKDAPSQLGKRSILYEQYSIITAIYSTVKAKLKDTTVKDTFSENNDDIRGRTNNERDKTLNKLMETQTFTSLSSQENISWSKLQLPITR